MLGTVGDSCSHGRAARPCYILLLIGCILLKHMARGEEDGNGFLSNNCQVSSHPSLQLKNNTQIYEEVLILRKVDMVLDFYLNIKDIEYTIISDQVTTTDFENCIIFSHPFTYADINQEQLRGHNVALDMIIFVNGNNSFCLDSGLIFSLRSCLSTLQNMTQKFQWNYENSIT